MKKELSSRGKRERNNLIFYCAMLAFPIAQFCLFYIFVNFNSIIMSFERFNTDGTFSFAGFENFERIFIELGTLQNLQSGLENSLIAWLFNLLVSTPAALLFSYYMYKKRFASGFFKVVLFSPSVISAVVIVTMFQMLVEDFIPKFFNANFNTNMLGLLTMSETVIPTLLFYSLWVGMGTSILMYLGAMGNINESVIEAAQIDGVTPMKEFFFVVLPQIFPTLIVFLTTGLAGFFTNQLNLYTFFAHMALPRYNTIGYYMYVQTIRSSGMANYPYVAAMGLLTTAITVPVVLLARKLLNKINPMGDE